MDYQATAVDVEHIFSHGRLVLPYVHSCLNVQLTHALMCVGSWSLLGLIDDSDIKEALELDVIGKENELPVGWDSISA